MKKTSTVQAFKSEIFKEQKLMIGLDLGDRWSFYCVLDEAGQVILEQKLPMTPEAMKQTFGKIPRSLMEGLGKSFSAKKNSRKLS
jgi:transposase